RGGCAVKTSGALGDDLRERGYRARAERVMDQAIASLAPRIGTRAACRAAGVAQASWYRRHRASPAPPRPAPVPHRDRPQPRALSPAERAAILDALHCPRFADLAPAEVWAILLDEGTYLGSQSTFYRLLRAAGPPIPPLSNPSWPQKARTRSTRGTSPSCMGPRNGRTTTCTSSWTSTPATPWAGWSPPASPRPWPRSSSPLPAPSRALAAGS